MPVTIRLVDLCSIQGTEHLWPDRFRAFMAAIENDPGEKTGWGLCADWLDEVEEHGLAKAFRIIARPDTTVLKQGMYWYLKQLPSMFGYDSFLDSRLIASVCNFSKAIDEILKELE